MEYFAHRQTHFAHRRAKCHLIKTHIFYLQMHKGVSASIMTLTHLLTVHCIITFLQGFMNKCSWFSRNRIIDSALWIWKWIFPLVLQIHKFVSTSILNHYSTYFVNLIQLMFSVIKIFDSWEKMFGACAANILFCSNLNSFAGYAKTQMWN